MYPHLIEVHDAAEGGEILINIDAIEGIYCEKLTEYAFCMTIDVVDGAKYQVRESYEELKRLIFDAGCIIAKADPRLENKPLTMEALESMEGEPVWNSNSRQWMIVHRFVQGHEDPDKAFVWMVKNNSQMEVMKEDDLVKFPLYRMKGGR